MSITWEIRMLCMARDLLEGRRAVKSRKKAVPGGVLT